MALFVGSLHFLVIPPHRIAIDTDFDILLLLSQFVGAELVLDADLGISLFGCRSTLFPLIAGLCAVARMVKFLYLERILLFGEFLYLQDKYHGSTRRITVVMELMTGGDLEGYLKQKYPKGMPEPEARRLLCQIASAFQYLSGRNYIHRDLKPANILLTEWNTGGAGKLPDAKLSDFGFARQVDPNGLMNSKVGSPLYMAPEVLDTRPYSPSVDLWSTGIIFMQMLTGIRPFPHARQEQDIIDFVKDPTLMSNQIAGLKLSPEGKTLLASMLTTDPKKRPTWDTFLESDYVRPKADLAASVVAGVQNWMLRVTAYESAITLGFPVDANLSVADFRKSMHTMFKLKYPLNELILLSPRRGILDNGRTMGDYYELRQGEVATSDRLACFAFSSDTLNGGLKVYEPEEASLKMPALHAFEFEALSPNVPLSSLATDISKWPLKQVQQLAKEVDQQIKATEKVDDWHIKLTGWKMAIEAHMNHANELLAFADSISRTTTRMTSAKHRTQGILAYTNYLRSTFQNLIKSFERVHAVIKEVSSPMSRIPSGIPAMFQEARSISLAPLPQAFPAVQVQTTATLDNLLDETGMTSHLTRCVEIHRSILQGELMFSKSSDPEAAQRYGFSNYNYNGPAWSSTILVADKNSPPALIYAMGALNNHLGAIPPTHPLVNDGNAADGAYQAVTKTHHELNEEVRKGLSALATVLQRPATFVLTSDMLSGLIPLLNKIVELYEKLTGEVSMLVSKTNSLITTRQAFDRRCIDQWQGIVKNRVPFEEFAQKMANEWRAVDLDFIGAKARSLDKLLAFPQEFRAMTAEIERRRKWVESLRASVAETNTAYNSLVEEERQVRDFWWANHNTFITRFREILPPNHEILNPMPAGFMGVQTAMHGINDYPRLNIAGLGSPSPSSSSSLHSSLPQPQTSTEEEFYRMSSSTLLSKVIELSREVEVLRRQRQSFFQTGVDDALRAENDRLHKELAELGRR